MELIDAARGRGIVERCCVLAEQRLDYLTELFETGRWRRYFGEVAFLDNIQESKRAVETWRGLLNREATADNRPIDLSWLGCRSTSPPGRLSMLQEPPTPKITQLATAAPVDTAQPGSEIVAPTQPEPGVALPVDVVAAGQPMAVQDGWQYALSPDRVKQRYPLLHNAF
jgi:uncharacterized repeat protein (TIGR03809 family)